MGRIALVRVTARCDGVAATQCACSLRVCAWARARATMEYLHRRPLPPPPLMRRANCWSHVHPPLTGAVTSGTQPARHHLDTHVPQYVPVIGHQWIQNLVKWLSSCDVRLKSAYRSVYSRSLRLSQNVSLCLFTKLIFASSVREVTTIQPGPRPRSHGLDADNERLQKQCGSYRDTVLS